MKISEEVGVSTSSAATSTSIDNANAMLVGDMDNESENILKRYKNRNSGSVPVTISSAVPSASVDNVSSMLVSDQDNELKDITTGQNNTGEALQILADSQLDVTAPKTVSIGIQTVSCSLTISEVHILKFHIFKHPIISRFTKRRFHRNSCCLALPCVS